MLLQKRDVRITLYIYDILKIIIDSSDGGLFVPEP
jgi:hypothetical protein